MLIYIIHDMRDMMIVLLTNELYYDILLLPGTDELIIGGDRPNAKNEPPPPSIAAVPWQLSSSFHLNAKL